MRWNSLLHQNEHYLPCGVQLVLFYVTPFQVLVGTLGSAVICFEYNVGLAVVPSEIWLQWSFMDVLLECGVILVCVQPETCILLVCIGRKKWLTSSRNFLKCSCSSLCLLQGIVTVGMKQMSVSCLVSKESPPLSLSTHKVQTVKFKFNSQYSTYVSWNKCPKVISKTLTPSVHACHMQFPVLEWGFLFLADYIAWKGRYCPFDFVMFENFMLYILAQVMGNIPAGSDPWDIDIDADAIGTYHYDRGWASPTRLHQVTLDPPIDREYVPHTMQSNAAPPLSSN